ncbi:hypothetical protein ACSTK0_25145, partial [Vibrio parahaemolyticus]
HKIDFAQAPQHVGEIALWTLGYIGIGIVWSMFKWMLYTKQWARNVRTASTLSEHESNWYQKWKKRGVTGTVSDIDVIKQKSRICNWAVG